VAGPLADRELDALLRVELDYTRDLDSVWADSSDHVPLVNGAILTRLVEDFSRRTRPEATARPLGWALMGPAGAGKTHMLGALRREMWQRGGWFVLLDLLDVNDFWATTALGFVYSLNRPMADGRSQGVALFDRLRARFGLPPAILEKLVQPGIEGWRTVARDFSAAVRRAEPQGTLTHRDCVMAFTGLVSGDAEVQDFALAWLTGNDVEQTGKTMLGLMRSGLPARKAVEGLSWLMALAGPTLCALDQIDAIVSVAHADAGIGASGEDVHQNRALAVIDELAGGLMELREVTRRTVTVVSTLEQTWETLCQRAIASFKDRFELVRLRSIGSAAAAHGLVAKRLAEPYREAGFAPPYPSWPFRPEAFSGVALFSPRQLLQACRAHIETCLASGRATELAAFANAIAVPEGNVAVDAADPPAAAMPFPAPLPAGNGAPAVAAPAAVPTVSIDARFDALCAVPPPPELLDLGGDDARIGGLLLAALRALVRQSRLPPGQDFLVEDDVSPLHARLRRIDHDNGSREVHHCFRAIPQTSAIAVQTRLQQAITASGIDRELPFRHLIVLRRGDWPGGPKTAAMVRQFELRGGIKVAPEAADFSRFAALQTLLAEAPPGLDAWLRARRPLAASPFFRGLGLVDEKAAPDAGPGAAAPASVPIGTRLGDRRVVELELAMLARHVAVIAGAGSGKTVLLRRLIEEAALAGVPSIVLDSNNDLVRLGEPWPEPPAGFSAADAAKANRFAGAAEVVVWTPGRARGNPLRLAPLPDFSVLRDDAEEREMAVGMAQATLDKLIAGGGRSGELRRGVLSGALRHFARMGGGELRDLVALLRDLPPEASDIGQAAKLAGEVADAVTAAMARNPLLDGGGAPRDPAALLTGSGGRVRVSVVNLAGLPSEEARQEFVGQLLMALFGYVRRHPAGPGRTLVGLLVMDEAQNFAPSGHATPSGAAAVALARQARKYGLGMVFATQAPKAIDHNIIANCTTQLFGLTNSPAALDAVRDMLRTRGGGGEDLGRLPRGQFYLTTAGTERPQKIDTPLCLTYHPASPPSEEAVLERAIRSRAG